MWRKVQVRRRWNSHLEGHSITLWQHEWAKPQHRLTSERSAEILKPTLIIERLTTKMLQIMAQQLQLAVFDCRSRTQHEPEMTREERTEHDAEHQRDRSTEDKQESFQLRGLLHHRSMCGTCSRTSKNQRKERGIEGHQKKIFVVSKADAIRDPRTVVIHLQHTSATDATVVTSVWLVLHALPAKATTTCLLHLERLHRAPSSSIIQGQGAVTTPPNIFSNQFHRVRHMARVCENSLHKTKDDECCQSHRGERLHQSSVTVPGPSRYQQRHQVEVDLN
mmetsp:Transcript_19639/g.52371  ORF Transcript_19639/g.52371 Transcript_19639/m.52371 type:complete len:278 (+) Transcript_19639:163-996(+)